MQSTPFTLNSLDFTSIDFEPKPKVNTILAPECSIEQKDVVNTTSNKIELDTDKIKKNPLDDILSVTEFKKMLEESDKEAWTRNDWA